MAYNTADLMLDRLHEWGVERIYGYPGDGINGIMGSLEERTEDIRFVQARHEELAAFMACAHAKFTGEVGVCLATSGPGAIHLLNGLYDAKMDHQPVLAIVGQQARAALGGDYQQEVDLVSLFKDVAPHYVHMCSHPAQMRHLVDRAVRIARGHRTVTCIIVPNDIQTEKAVRTPPREHGTVHSGVGYTKPRVLPQDIDLERAAGVLNEGERVAMLVGAGALGAGAEVAAVADRLGAGVAKALLGQAVVSDDLPWVTGSIGLLGTEPSWNLMQKCDTLLMVGSGFPYSEFLPEEGQARGVQIDIDPRMLGIRYPMEVNLVGDSRETLRALLPLLEHKEDRSWRERIEKQVGEWWELMEERAMQDADPVNPQRVFHELSLQMPDDAITTCDSGSAANWWARHLRVKETMLATLSGNLATMGPAVPYALAAKFCWPDRPVVACVGDGAMQMNGLNGLITIAKYWQEWRDPRLVICVLDNHDLNQVTWEQRVMEGDPEFPASQDVPPFPYAGYARSLGLEGIRVESPEGVASAWSQAFAADRPCVLDIRTDPNVPPLPPHITFDQARAFFASMVKGDPQRRGVVKQTAEQMAAKVVPDFVKP